MKGTRDSETNSKAIFLDRDGVINVKLPPDQYVSDPSQFNLLPDVAEALAIFRGLGYVLVLVTNQRGIGRGFMSESDLENVHAFMEGELSKRGARLDALYHCPHDSWEECLCRKPAPGMVLAAAEDFQIDLAVSYMVGDSASDIEAGRRAGTRTVRIAWEDDPEADLVFPTLLDFAHYLQQRVEARNGSHEDVQ